MEEKECFVIVWSSLLMLQKNAIKKEECIRQCISPRRWIWRLWRWRGRRWSRPAADRAPDPCEGLRSHRWTTRCSASHGRRSTEWMKPPHTPPDTRCGSHWRDTRPTAAPTAETHQKTWAQDITDALVRGTTPATTSRLKQFSYTTSAFSSFLLPTLDRYLDYLTISCIAKKQCCFSLVYTSKSAALLICFVFQ